MATRKLRPCAYCGKPSRGTKGSKLPFCSLQCRFWMKVDKTGDGGCWLWTGTRPSFGHGQIRVGERAIYAHRLAWEWANGPLPDDQCVLHRCDVPACVNPAHLFIGSRADNMRDMWRKGRGSKPPRMVGPANPNTKLTAALVRAIRSSPEDALTVAERFGIPRRHVYAIRLRAIWKHVE